MSHTFLTLEGSNNPRKLTLFGLGGIRPAEVRKPWHGDPYRETDEAEAAERSGVFKREILFKDADEGLTTSIWAQYGLESDEALGFWKRLTRMVTPPARVRRSFTRITRAFKVPRQFKPPQKAAAFLKKGLRYVGAANTLPLTAFGGGKLRNKMFGLKGNELKAFDAAAKIYRIGAVTAVSIAGAPALAGAMGKSAALALPKLKGMLSQGGTAILKDGATNSIWKLAADTAGTIIGSRLPRQSVESEEYAALPESTPVYVPHENDENVSPPMPPTVAGSGSMAPYGYDYEARRLGEVIPYDREAIQNQPQAVPFPNALTPERDAEAIVDDEWNAMREAARAQAAQEQGEYVEPVRDSANEEKLRRVMDEDSNGLEADSFDGSLAVCKQMQRDRVRRGLRNHKRYS